MVPEPAAPAAEAAETTEPGDTGERKDEGDAGGGLSLSLELVERKAPKAPGPAPKAPGLDVRTVAAAGAEKEASTGTARDGQRQGGLSLSLRMPLPSASTY